MATTNQMVTQAELRIITHSPAVMTATHRLIGCSKRDVTRSPSLGHVQADIVRSCTCAAVDQSYQNLKFDVQTSRRGSQFLQVSEVMPTYSCILVCTTNYLLPLICCNAERKQSWIGTVCAASCQLCHTVRHGHQVQHLQQSYRNEFASRPSPHINKQQGISVALASCNSKRHNDNSNIHNGSDEDNTGLKKTSGAGSRGEFMSCSQDTSMFTRQVTVHKTDPCSGNAPQCKAVHELQGRQ